jgi:hypothetical protein
METITLVQTGKRYSLPLILIDEPGGTYWSQCIDFFKNELLARKFISPSDFHMFERVDSVQDVVARINRFYRRYHSLRYVDGTLVIRMRDSIEPAGLESLRHQFKDLLTPGGTLRLSGALPEEADEPDLSDLTRLVIDFNQSDFGRLRALIDALNDL